MYVNMLHNISYAEKPVRRRVCIGSWSSFCNVLQVGFAYPDIRYPDIRIYPLILWHPKIRIS